MFVVGQVSKGDLSTVKCEMLWERWFTYQLSIKGRSFGFSHNVVHTFQISGGWRQPFLSVRLHTYTLLLINHGSGWVWQVSRRCDTASPLSTLRRNINILRRSYPDSSWPPSLSFLSCFLLAIWSHFCFELPYRVSYIPATFPLSLPLHTLPTSCSLTMTCDVTFGIHSYLH